MLKFSCEKTLLQQAVSAASRAVASKSSIPALEGILLEGDMNLTLSGYNMQTGIRTAIEAQIHEAGRIVLNDKDVEVFNFGKHRGVAVEEVFRKEPSYYDWIMNGNFTLDTKQVVSRIKTQMK